MIVVKATAIRNTPIEVVIATGSADSIINMDFVLRQQSSTPGYTSGKYGEAVVFVDMPNIAIGDHKPVSLKMKGSGMANVVKTLGRQTRPCWARIISEATSCRSILRLMWSGF